MENSIIVTGREYSLVSSSLRIPDNDLNPNTHILSVGEGLSDYVKRLHEKYQVNAVALDPIYALGNEILNSDPRAVQIVLKKYYKNQFIYESEFQIDKQSLSLPDTTQMIAGSVYNLPFTNESFNLVVSNRMAEHVNLFKAIPELLRVMKSDGELRISGLSFTADPLNKKLYPRSIKFSGKKEDYGYFFEESLDAIDALHDLIQQKALNAYVILNSLPKRSEVRDELNLYSVGLLIITRDNHNPQLTPWLESDTQAVLPSGKNNSHYPFLGKLFRVGKPIEGTIYRMDKDSYKLEEIFPKSHFS